MLNELEYAGADPELMDLIRQAQNEVEQSEDNDPKGHEAAEDSAA